MNDQMKSYPYCTGHPDCHNSRVSWYARVHPTTTTSSPVIPWEQWPLHIINVPQSGFDRLCRSHALLWYRTAAG